MRLLITTQAVDEQDPILGFFCRWIIELANRVDSIQIICLREGEHHLPSNVSIHALGPGSKLARAIRLKRLAWRLRHDYDVVFVHMNPEYLIVAWPLWKLLGKKVMLWYNHPAHSLRLTIAAAFADVIFYTSPYAATARIPRAQQMSVGIDTELFKPMNVPRARQALYMQGRIMPSKHIDVALAALRILREKIPATLTLVGPELDAAYAQRLRTQFQDLLDIGAVQFLGSKKNEDTPALMGTAGVALNLATAGHFDKTAFEPMACETPIVVSSVAFRGIVPDEWIIPENDPAALARTLERLIQLPEEAYRALGSAERTEVVAHHSLTVLVEQISARLASMNA